MNLVIVESPSKAKTIEKYLGKNYIVDASGGHVRDLPEKTLGVDVKHDFEPKYVVNKDKKAVIKRLSDKAKKCESVYLATDPDREGEAISWHLAETLGLKSGEYSRIEFNEISQKAVTNALKEPREIDMDLVNAQQARRVLDRLVGYKLSPYLCKKLQDKLSAGRVQSAALKMIVDREKEIKAFVPKEYWYIVAELFKPEEAAIVFKALLAEFKGKKCKPENKEQADAVLENLKGAAYTVSAVKKSQSKSHPLPPFTTSTMQQDASHKLGLAAPMTMQLAQQLYEGVEIAGEGQHALVTYIRTDSVRISTDAQNAALAYIGEHFGKEDAPEKPNFYKSKKSAQDAHEAIRPINLARTPESIKDKVQKNQYRLYKLIYDRFLASQMADAVYNTMAVSVKANDCLFKVNGKSLAFKGYTAVYDAASKDSKEEDESVSAKLPNLAVGDALTLKKLNSEQKFTKPPARYSDATLIKAMEEKGIGRPSTYASIIGVLERRPYKTKESKFLVPTELAFQVDEIIEKYFGKIVDLTFTAKMEEELDDIEQGGKNWKAVIENFYPWLTKHLEEAGAELVEETDIKCDKCGSMMLLRTGRFGKYLACSNYPECKNIKSYDTEVSDVKCDKCGAFMVVKNGNYGKYLACPNYPECSNIKSLGERPSEETCEACGTPMVIKSGRFGEYLSCPNCKKNKPIVKAVGVCPRCGKPVAEKRSKAGKIFYGCTGYPECNFMSWDIPTDKKCPKCEHFLYLKNNKSGKYYKCSECDYEEDYAEPGTEKTPESAE